MEANREGNSLYEAAERKARRERGRKVVAVDFDGTLADEELQVNPFVLGAVQTAFDAGHFIVIYTARPWADRDLVTAWALENEVPFDVVVCGKLRYDVQLDDRTWRPEDVEKMLEGL